MPHHPVCFSSLIYIAHNADSNVTSFIGDLVSRQQRMDLQQYLDNAPDGVIYFSMGSNLQSSQMPESKRDAILKAFSKLKQKVLWKWETETLPGQPPNVKLGKWLPQNDILGDDKQRDSKTEGRLDVTYPVWRIDLDPDRENRNTPQPKYILSLRGYRVHLCGRFGGVRTNVGCAILTRDSIHSFIIDS
ncbi:hypothetical protein ANN_10944 [Periplaneta americana]|uniref:Uncharacterized protein n=1 Tax=Periplaneta americana TaxID=6978 RepID=A0ABQ8T4X4_PERAM|nr:hypothetical protein ANN_10944 [Periplaneta americana]